jgi:hypothetical protein
MIRSNPNSPGLEILEKLEVAGSWLAHGARPLLSWTGFLLLCLFVGGEEVRRQAKKHANHVDRD